MKTIKFTKMHGTGNDYIYIDAIKYPLKNPAKLAKTMSSRHTGVGSDGLILIHRSDKADFRMQMFNSDGSEAEMCGNGIRCFAKYVYDHKYTNKKDLAIETLAGIKKINLHIKNNKIVSATVDMGEPILERENIPMIGAPGRVINETISLDDAVKFNITAISMGNPHAIIVVEDAENFPVEKYGPLVEEHQLFPNKTNVEFVEIINEKEVIQRTWERGAGETLSCGTGASAVTVACSLIEKAAKEVTVHLRGGDLQMKWDYRNNHVYMSGTATEVFTGEWPLTEKE